MAAEFLRRADRPIAKVLEDVPHKPGVPKPSPILRVEGMRRSFGGLVAVDVDHLEIQRGSVTALIGPNGSGKTTLFNLLCGFDRPEEGEWRFYGVRDSKGVSLKRRKEGIGSRLPVLFQRDRRERGAPLQQGKGIGAGTAALPSAAARSAGAAPPVAARSAGAAPPVAARSAGLALAGRKPHEIARLGMVRTFQLTRSLSLLTVLENVLLAANNQHGERLARSLGVSWRSVDSENQVLAEVVLAKFGLEHMRDEYAGSLSGGQRKLLELARAVMSHPSLLLLDEPLAGVNPALVESILGHMLAFPTEGMTVLFVEHSLDVVMSISDWVVCLGEGRVIAEGPPEAVAANPLVIDAYLGKEEK